MRIGLFIIFFIGILCSGSYAQSTKRGSKKSNPTSLSSGSGESSQRIFSDDKAANKPYKINWAEQKKKEYEQRMEANAKKYRKMEKEMKKPQYSDPSYFGHKKQPKKRKPGKKKLCKECGMRH